MRSASGLRFGYYPVSNGMGLVRYKEAEHRIWQSLLYNGLYSHLSRPLDGMRSVRFKPRHQYLVSLTGWDSSGIGGSQETPTGSVKLYSYSPLFVRQLLLVPNHRENPTKVGDHT